MDLYQQEWLSYALLPLLLLISVVYLYYTQTKKNKTVFLSDKSKKKVVLSEKVMLSHDTRLFRFALPDPNAVLGLPIGKHFKVYGPNKTGVVRGQWNGRPDPEAEKSEIERKYTPTSSNDNMGYFDLIIKVYKGGELEKFPDGGKMSQYMDSLQVGDSLLMSGPYGLHEYLGNGLFMMVKRQVKYNKIGMIAGGTGITPMLQIISAVLKNENDRTELFLLYANKTESDILLRDMLESLARKYPRRFHLHYTLDKAPNEMWPYSEGFVNAEMISEHMPEPSVNHLILLCGPPPMITYACRPNLEKLGYPKQNIKEC